MIPFYLDKKCSIDMDQLKMYSMVLFISIQMHFACCLKKNPKYSSPEKRLVMYPEFLGITGLNVSKKVLNIK